MMEWNGIALATTGEMMRVVTDIAESGDREEAKAFLAEYAKMCDDGMATARSNLGYLAGYYSAETMTQIHDVFDVSHPIFGRSVPTPDEALAAGKAWAEGRPK